MPNKVFLNDKGVVEVVFEGDQTGQTINTSVEQAKVLVKKLQSENKKVLFLFNFTNTGKTNIEARQRSLKAMNEFYFDKFAGYGANHIIRYVSNTVSKISGKFNKTRHFKNRTEAEKWLYSY